MEDSLFYRSAYEFDLPKELIAQHPVTPRDSSRLMVINRAEGSIKEIPFHQITTLSSANNSLVKCKPAVGAATAPGLLA